MLEDAVIRSQTKLLFTALSRRELVCDIDFMLHKALIHIETMHGDLFLATSILIEARTKAGLSMA
jgi:hypothetical protein